MAKWWYHFLHSLQLRKCQVISAMFVSINQNQSIYSTDSIISKSNQLDEIRVISSWGIMRYVLINTLPIAVSFRGVHVLLHLLIPLKKDPVQSGLNDPTKKGRGPLIHNSLRLWSLLSNSRKEKSFSWRSEVVNIHDKLTIIHCIYMEEIAAFCFDFSTQKQILL